MAVMRDGDHPFNGIQVESMLDIEVTGVAYDIVDGRSLAVIVSDTCVNMIYAVLYTAAKSHDLKAPTYGHEQIE